MNTEKQKKVVGYLTRILLLTAMVFALSAVVNIPATTVQAVTSSTVKKKAKAIVSETTIKSSDSKLTKLKKLFKYVETNWEYDSSKRVYSVKKTLAAQRTYAYSIYKDGGGTCYQFAAGYAFLAKYVLGSKYTVRIALGQTNGFGNGLQDHAWVEIKISGTWYIFDPNMDKFAADSSLKYYKKKRSSSAMKKVYNKYKSVKYVTVKD